MVLLLFSVSGAKVTTISQPAKVYFLNAIGISLYIWGNPRRVHILRIKRHRCKSKMKKTWI